MTPLLIEITPAEKLHVYCDALCNMPEPKQQWVVNL